MLRVAIVGVAEHGNSAVLVTVASERVFRDAAAALGRNDIDAFLHAMGKSIGPPWQATHKLAAAAALAATGRRTSTPR